MTQDLDAVAARTAEVAPIWAATPPRERAGALVAAADALLAETASLVETAMSETGLSEARLTGELKRTAVQLKLFAEVVVDGTYLDARIDDADANFVLGARPDVRRYRVAVGPVLNFAASNFPFAFSVAGGDTAAALAAGCPVVVKTHSGHPKLSVQTAGVVSGALEAAGAPEGVLQVISGQQAGVDMLNDPRIKAGSFTGSIRIGRMLADIAAARPTPIPFYGELGSVNPVFVTAAALAKDAESILDGFITSVSGSAGQLCTKPGFLFAPAGAALAEGIASRTATIAEQRLLNPGISSGFKARRDAVLGTPIVTVLAEGSLRIDDEGQGWATPTIVSAPVSVLREHREELLEESFGPLTGSPGALGAFCSAAGPPVLRSLQRCNTAVRGPRRRTTRAPRSEPPPSPDSLARLRSRTLRKACCLSRCVTTTRGTSHSTEPWPANRRVGAQASRIRVATTTRGQRSRG